VGLLLTGPYVELLQRVDDCGSGYFHVEACMSPSSVHWASISPFPFMLFETSGRKGQIHRCHASQLLSECIKTCW